MDFTEALFLIQLIVFAGIFVYRLKNIVNNGELYGVGTGVILFIGSLATWFLAMQIFLMNVENTLYSVIYQFQSVLLWFGVVFLVYEAFIELKYYLGFKPRPDKQGVGRPGQ